MWWRRIVYGFVTLGAFIFYLVNGEWLSWILLLGVLFLPWFSLVLSLPAMILTKIRLFCPDKVSMNSAVNVQVEICCPLPVPPVKWNFLAYEVYSGKRLTFAGNEAFLADHCGSIRVSMKKSFVYDYLGLVRLPKTKKEEKVILILPQSVPVTNLPSLNKYLAANWKPKPGGGYAENYDLREYREGDDLRQIHWKLAAKTGKVILREPMIPIRGKLALSMLLQGTPEELDRKLGRFIYLSHYFLQKDLPHEFHCATGDGVCSYIIENEQTLENALYDVLQRSKSEESSISVTDASWHYTIGGEGNEA